jgi:hypothetical protein
MEKNIFSAGNFPIKNNLGLEPDPGSESQATTDAER